ncbi:MAG: glutathione S-transferase [Rubrivivax sp.]|nr:MAG: glutathione S-transferase [Rubrivivax sp.]
MSLPVLYSFRRCPYAIRARLALKCAQVPVVLREVVLRDKPAEMLAISPKGTVPVLQLSDGHVLQESLDIMRWALRKADPEGWLRQGDAAQTQAWIDLNDGPFKALLDRYKYPERHPEFSAYCYRDQAVGLFIGPLNQALSQSRFLTGPSPALADMAIVPFIRQFAQVDAQWFAQAPFPALRAWLQGLVGSSLFEAAMARHPPWKTGDAPTLL